eukprot:9498234-Pyramimonas_sp.AAC.1
MPPPCAVLQGVPEVDDVAQVCSASLPSPSTPLLRRLPLSKNNKKHKHALSELRVHFLDGRWTPTPAAPPRPPMARSARQGGGSSAAPGRRRGVPTVSVYDVFAPRSSAPALPQDDDNRKHRAGQQLACGRPVCLSRWPRPVRSKKYGSPTRVSPLSAPSPDLSFAEYTTKPMTHL